MKTENRKLTSSSTSPSFTSVTISNVMSSPSQNGSSSDVSMIDGEPATLPDACRLRMLFGLPSFLTVRAGVFVLLGVTLGDGLALGVRCGFDGVVFGVVV